jgi:hypothetical protein
MLLFNQGFYTRHKVLYSQSLVKRNTQIKLRKKSNYHTYLIVRVLLVTQDNNFLVQLNAKYCS